MKTVSSTVFDRVDDGAADRVIDYVAPDGVFIDRSKADGVDRDAVKTLAIDSIGVASVFVDDNAAVVTGSKEDICVIKTKRPSMG
ncbi:hypothetical protein NDU88_004691 [Pleurodeles waltl]|uniref:Uncharacterized protein n=1 Tax=Pleurodeles waltl TaxID=8319 RepID=A0AAV7UH61_PLEWA|nr:hypothetical protein NDU88_004691 [Pleurodeles waltl]